MGIASDSVDPAAEPRRHPGGVSKLALHLFLSLLFALAMGQLVLGNYDTTYTVWVTWTVGWLVIWGVFAVLQVMWWRKGHAKFWRPIYAWALFGHIVVSLILLPLLIYPRFRHWLFRVMSPTDPPEPPEWETSLRALARLRDEGVLTDTEFEAKKHEIVGRA